MLWIEVWVALWVSAVDRGMGSAVGQCCAQCDKEEHCCKTHFDYELSGIADSSRM